MIATGTTTNPTWDRNQYGTKIAEIGNITLYQLTHNSHKPHATLIPNDTDHIVVVWQPLIKDRKTPTIQALIKALQHCQPTNALLWDTLRLFLDAKGDDTAVKNYAKNRWLQGRDTNLEPPVLQTWARLWRRHFSEQTIPPDKITNLL